uniref:Uncharacterized protein n=1 Tax=Amphiprion ocellaris TaxID=80972 RepID=A0AAQ5ZNI5_AMPOC
VKSQCEYDQRINKQKQLPTVKHIGGSVQEMIFIDGTMNTCGYTKILHDKMTSSRQFFSFPQLLCLLLFLCSFLTSYFSSVSSF